MGIPIDFAISGDSHCQSVSREWSTTVINIMIPVLFGAGSAAVVLAMAGATNAQILKQFDTEANHMPYAGSVFEYIVLACIIVISTVCGGLFLDYAVSAMAIVKLGLCYFAVLAAAVIDYKLRIIPNYIPIALLGAWALIFLYEWVFLDRAGQELVFSLLGCALCGFILLIANKFSHGGIGGGDIKLLSCVGLMCGAYTVFSTLLLALICCCIWTLVGVLRRKITLKNSVPFGPFIYLGYVLMCLMTLY